MDNIPMLTDNYYIRYYAFHTDIDMNNISDKAVDEINGDVKKCIESVIVIGLF